MRMSSSSIFQPVCVSSVTRFVLLSFSSQALRELLTAGLLLSYTVVHLFLSYLSKQIENYGASQGRISDFEGPGSRHCVSSDRNRCLGYVESCSTKLSRRLTTWSS